MKSFQTEILTPQKSVFSGQVAGLVLRGAEGYFGILAGHAPLLARLLPGQIKITRGGEETVCRAGAGFVQVEKERVSILLDEINL
ncbi:MAG: ATP synthase F1 subunit epsilon [Kiritimatiellae bacterium]|jgi:F-type H+-transporting ATPase subunit epsilon|nr:ATP synthase F1 subunit epsilon [Kiritimatiellia bacterium]